MKDALRIAGAVLLVVLALLVVLSRESSSGYCERQNDTSYSTCVQWYENNSTGVR